MAEGTPQGIQLRFMKERDTKNTTRYAEVNEADEAPAVGTLYVQKSALAAIGNPDALAVVIVAGGE